MMKFLAVGFIALLASAAPALAQIAPQVGSLDTLILKAGPGTLLDGYVSVSAAGYLMIFNRTTTPTNGSYTIGTASGDVQDCFNVQAAGTYGFSSFGIPGEVFSTGIVMAWSSTGCATLTLASGTIQAMHGRAQ